MKNKAFKKSLSVVLAVLMLMSCWVWIPGEHNHAHAALTDYVADEATVTTNSALLNSISFNKTPQEKQGTWPVGSQTTTYSNVVYTKPVVGDKSSGYAEADHYYVGNSSSNTFARQVSTLFIAPTVFIVDQSGQTPQTGVMLYQGGYASSNSVNRNSTKAVFTSRTVTNNYLLNDIWPTDGAKTTGSMFQFADYWRGKANDGDYVGTNLDFAWSIGQSYTFNWHENQWDDSKVWTTNGNAYYSNHIKFVDSFADGQYAMGIYPVIGICGYGGGSDHQWYDMSQANVPLHVLNWKAVQDTMDYATTLINTLKADPKKYSTQSVRNLVALCTRLNNLNPDNWQDRFASGIDAAVVAWATEAKTVIPAIKALNANNMLKKVELTYDNMFSFSDWANSSSAYAENGSTLTVDITNGKLTYKDTKNTADSYTNNGSAGLYAIPVIGGQTYIYEYDATATTGGARTLVFETNSAKNGFTSVLKDNSGTGHQKVEFTAGGTAGSVSYIHFRFGTTVAGATVTFSNIRVYPKSMDTEKNFSAWKNRPLRKVYTYDTKIGTVSDKPVRPGYKFVDWMADTDFNEAGDGSIASYSTTAMQQSLNLFSKFVAVDVNYDNLFSFDKWADSKSSEVTRGTVTYDVAKGTLTTKSLSKAEGDALVAGGLTVSSSQDCYTNYGAASGFADIAVKGNTEYTLEFNATDAGQCYVFYYTASAAASTAHKSLGASKGDNTKTFTTPSDCTRIQFRFGSTGAYDKSITFSKIAVYKSEYADVIKSIDNRQLRINAPASAANLYTPARTGYKFQGWYYDEAYTKAVGSSDYFTDNTTVYSKWAKYPNDVNYDNLFSLSDWANSKGNGAWYGDVKDADGNVTGRLGNRDEKLIKTDLNNSTITLNYDTSYKDSSGNAIQFLRTNFWTSYGNEAHYEVPLEPSTKYVFEVTLSGTAGATAGVLIFQRDNGNTSANFYPKVNDGTTKYEFTTLADTKAAWIRFDNLTPGSKITFSNIRLYKATDAAKVDSITDTKPRDNITDSLSLITPVRPGYTFTGWTDASGNAVSNSAAKGFTASTPIYSNWTVNNYKVFFDNTFDFTSWTPTSSSATVKKTDSGTGIVITTNSTSGEGCVSTPYFPVEPGKSYTIDVDVSDGAWDIYIFFCDKNGSWIDFVDGESNRFSNDSTWDNTFTAPNKDSVVQAQIRFDSNGAGKTVTFDNVRVYEEGKTISGVPTYKTQSVTYDAAYGTLPTPTRTGYIFAGWALADGTKVDASTVVKTAGDHTLYSQWTPIKYTIQFQNVNSETAYSQTIEYDKAVNLTAYDSSKISKTGYTFTGWNTDSLGGGTAYTDKQSVKNLSSTNGATIKLYPQWKANTYTIKFNANGGSGTMADLAMTYDVSKNLTANAFTRTGFAFTGWNTKADGTGTSYTDKQSVKNLAASGSATLYAQWRVNAFTVKFVNAAGTTVSTKSYDYGTAAASVTKPANTAANYDSTNHYAYSWPTIANVTADATYTEIKTATKHTMSSKVTTAATCTAAGVRTYTCSGCAYSYTEAIAATGHSWGTTTYTWTNGTACKATRTCSTCKATETADAAISSEVTDEATCTVKGTRTYTAKFTVAWATTQTKAIQDVAVLGHSFTATTVSDDYLKSAATCTAAAVYYKSCSRCALSSKGQTGEATFTNGSALGHSWGPISYAWSTDYKTCTATRVCGRDSSHKETATATSTSAVKTAATCTVKGTTTYTATFTEAWAAKQTKDVQDIAVKAHSYTGAVKSDGNGKDATHSFKCVNGCNEYGGAVKHTWNSGVIDPDSTCLTGGTKTYTCTVSGCGATYTETVAAKGHTFGATTAAKAATCLAAGNSAYKKCATCNLYFADSAATNATDGKADTTSFVIAKKAHSYTGAVKSDGNGKDATHSFKCVNGCNEYGAAVKHTWNSGSVTTAATCIKEGVKTYTCTVSGCGATYTETIAATGHSFGTTTAAKAATCLAAGNSAYKQCSTCKLYFADSAATNATDGKADTTSFVIAKKAHSYTGAVKSDGNGKDATHSFKCVNGCNEYGAAVKHTWNSGSVTTAATCIKEGVKTYTCTVSGCGATYTEAVAAKGHSFGTTTAAKAATCLAEGNSAYKQCSTCKLYFEDSAETDATDGKADTTSFVIAKKAHSYTGTVKSDGNGKDATHSFKCVNGCNNYGAAVKHTWNSGSVTTAATCIKEGVKTYTCTVSGCGATYTESVAIDSTNHVNKENKAKVESTCTEVGYEAGVYCNDCKKWISGHAEIEATGHNFTPSAERINTLNNGTHNWTCANGCGAKGTTEGVDKATACNYEVSASANATCTTDGYTTYTCTDCKYGYSDRIPATGHADADKDHKCDNGCSVVQGTHGDADRNHVCDYGCKEAIGTCEDTNKDHKCDYGCAKAHGTCEDKDLDHDCDYGCDKVYGTCEDKDLDHDCDYGCDKYFGNHVDSDKNHICDYGCKVAIGTCADANKDHTCDYGCGKAYGTCEDENKDHECDYGCSNVYGTCEDKDLDHDCDYGCDKVYGTCEDKDLDHDCDYGCDKKYGDHVDSDKNHICDYGCKVAIGTCADANKDHKCDYGCDKDYGICKDENKDHKCDYGCDKVYGTCVDSDKDHDCDYGCGKKYGDHVDSDKNHACDYGCKVTFGTCEDKDLDHTCDYGCDKVYGTCVDNDKDHDCDYGCDKAYGDCEDKDLDHDCDYGCDKKYGTCEDKDLDHACDYGCGKKYGDHVDSDKNHACDYGCNVAIGACADASDDDDHICDYGCGKVLEACSDAEGDDDHNCDICGKADVSEHEYGQADCSKPATCIECGHETGTALGHNWLETTYSFANDGSACTATRVCDRNADHVETATAKVTSAVKTPATCTEDGWTTYTATFENVDWTETQTLDVKDITAINHDWSVTYNFAENGKTCTATRVCANDTEHNVTATAKITSAVKTPATCTTDGWTTYTATFEGVDWATEQKKDVKDLHATDHAWTVEYSFAADGSSCTATRVCGNDATHNITAEATITSKVKIPATCTVKGTTTYTATFEADWATEQKKDVQDIPAINHNWSVKYDFADDGSSCTATRVCANDSAHNVKVDATVTAAVKTPATCTTDGWTTYTATFDGFAWAAAQTLDVQDIPAINHNWSVKYDFAADGSSCTATRVCGNDATHNVTATATVTSAVKTPATCTVDGWTTYTATFENADWTETQTLELQDIPAIKHDWSVKYDFAADGSSCTATRVCANDAAHNVKVDAKVTSAVKIPATCTEDGWTTYTATFDGFVWATTQTLDVQDIPAIKHDWSVEYNFAADGSSCTATRVCGNDATHNVTVNATITSEVTNKATCTEKGTTTYTATFEADWAEVQKKALVDIKELGHIWNDTTYSFAENGKSCTATRVCDRDNSHVETANATITSKVKTQAICTEKGWTTYTATFDVDWAKEQTKDVRDISAVGHKWTSWTVSENANCQHGEVSVRKCSVCGKTETKDNGKFGMHVYVVMEGQAPTCTADGLSEYKFCTVCGLTEEPHVIPALGHNDKDNDGKCDECGGIYNNTCGNGVCSCICHKDNIFSKIIRFIYTIISIIFHKRIACCDGMEYLVDMSKHL